MSDSEENLEYFCEHYGYDSLMIKEELFNAFLVAVRRPGSWEGEAVYNLLGIINPEEDWEQYKK